MIVDDPYTEDTYDKGTGRDPPLIEKIYRNYGKPKRLEVTTTEDIATLLYQAYTDLKNGNNAGWNTLNTNYWIEGKCAYSAITYNIWHTLKREFIAHKYFAARTPGEDDFQEILLKLLTEWKSTTFKYDITFPGLLLKQITRRTEDHLRQVFRLENRGLGNAVIYLKDIDTLRQTQEFKADTELNESDSFDRVRQPDFDYDGDAFCRDSPETPEEAYEKAQMAAW